MKKILVLVADYPNLNGGVKLMYVHTRNLYYIKNNIEVTVLNFSSNKEYFIDNIRVISEKIYKIESKKYDGLVLHAANIRNHFLFLKKYEKNFSHLYFFFHGHEVLKLNETYPKPYDFMKKEKFLRLKFQNLYDSLKLVIWENYFPRIAYKSDFIFVSNCFFLEFKKYTKLNEKLLHNHIHIINNSIGSVFENNEYDTEKEKIYNFITIRNMLDESVYCIDLLCKIAKSNPDLKFLLIGRGNYFKYNSKPSNITWIDKYINHDNLLEYIDKAECALMLTRRDTQGVMSCELVSYGIPLITSDAPICYEIFGGIKNVTFIKNDNIKNENFKKVLKNIKQCKEKTIKYNSNKTIELEVKLIKNQTEVNE